MENQITVAKFGGTSVANIDSIGRCAEIIKKSLGVKVVVVSAQSGVTNLLVKLVTECYTKEFVDETISQIKKIVFPILESIRNSREVLLKIENILKDLEQLANMLLRLKTPQLSDEILSFGELISATLVAQIFTEFGLNVEYFSAKKIIKTDSNHGQAKPIVEDIYTNVQHLFSSNRDNIVITEGFIGSDYQGLTTTLGRGGSDYSAALIAEALQAKELRIWTDVPGIYQADPRAIPEAAAIEKMTFNEAAELATFGAKVLHPSTLWPAVRSNINVFIGSTFESNNVGTWITKNIEEGLPTVRAVAERKNQILLTIKSYDMVHAQGFLANVFQVLAKHKVSVDLVTTSEVSIALTLDHIGSQSIGNTMLTTSLLQELNEIGDVEIKTDENLSLVAIVGNNIHQTKNVSSRIFSELSEYNIRLFSHGASGHNMCLLVDQKDSSQVMQKIYNQFFM